MVWTIVIVGLLSWLFILQPILQIYLIFKKAKNFLQQFVLFIGFLSSIAFLSLFFYSSTFRGNFSGHGSYDEVPDYLIPAMLTCPVISLITLGLFFILAYGNYK